VNAQGGKATRRRRKAPQRHLPPVVEQSTATPFIFGWGDHLTRQERESLKERIALVVGIVIAVVVIALLAWGALLDNVIRPAQARDANNKPIAVVGNYVLTTGTFKALETFRNNDLNNTIAQYQSQLSQLNAQPAKNKAQITQYQQQIGQLQQEQTNLATQTEDQVITAQVAIQRGYTVGVPETAKLKAAAITAEEHALGGPKHYQQLIQTSGLAKDQLEMLIIGDYMQQKIQPKVIATVTHSQTEVRASHILLANTPKGKALATKLLSKIKNGANFAALARKYSIDKASAVKGGDLGYFPSGQMVKQFNDAAFSMKVGQIHIIHSQFGYHILKVTARKSRPLIAVQYSNAQQSAFASWVTRQKTALHVQNIVAASNLPQVATPTTNSGLPAPQQPAVPAPQRAPQQAPPSATHANPSAPVTRAKPGSPAKKP